MNRANLRQSVATPERFLDLLRSLRELAARRALLSEPPFPLPVLCLDQAEELFAADAGAESELLLQLVRAAVDHDQALALATIRSDAFGLMQSAPAFSGIHQVSLSLGRSHKASCACDRERARSFAARPGQSLPYSTPR